ncbi:MAG: YkvA family protein [Woeseiaceae bacterium]
MAMKIAFELTDRDLRFFRKALKLSREAVRDAEESEIIEAIRDVLETIRQSQPLPDFVGQRIPQLESMISMLTDDDWQLPATDRERLLATFVYFADPEDILPDDIPVIGYLDDVIIIELVLGELKHVREAYDDFCSFRKDFNREHGKKVDAVIRRDRLDRRRQQLHQRMRRRSARQAKSKLW